MRTAPEVQVKATPVNALATFVAKELTPVQLRIALERLGPADRALFDGKLIASGSASLAAVDLFTTEAAQIKGESPFEFGRRAGRFGAELGTRSVYKFIFALMSPESVLRVAPFMWKRVYDSGSIEAELGDHRGRLVKHDFPASPALCGRITGWFEFIAAKAAATSVTRHSACQCDGAPECTWEFTW